MTNTISYPECFLGSIVNPGEYWLVSKLRTHVKDVKILEEMMSDEMNQILTRPDPELLSSQCCVAVENKSARGTWKRGQIVEKIKQDFYKVFLVDSGCFINVHIKFLQLIRNDKYLKVEPLAFKLHLYGVVPFRITTDCKKKVSENWTRPAVEFISKLFSERILLYVKKVDIVNRTVFGDLCLINKPNGKLISLTKLLCTEEYGVYAESYFRRKVMEGDTLSSSKSCSERGSNSSQDLAMKMEIVKQWQLSTTQYQVKCEEGESSVTKSTSDGKHCISDSTGISSVSVEEKTKEASDVKSTMNDSFSPRSWSQKRERNSAGSVRSENSISSGEKKKEFNVVFEGNWNDFPTVGNDSTPGIFTLFRDSEVKPVDRIRNLNVSESIILNLENEGNFNNLSPMQRWAIPSILRGHNVVMIGGPKTGKSLSFVISLLTVLQERTDAKEMPVGNGPVAVILCSDSQTCGNLSYICHVLLRRNSEREMGRSNVRVEVVHGSSRENKSWVQLTNGCELLISTPHCLDRLLKHRGITNFERLEYLVLDEVDVIVQEPFFPAVKAILNQSTISKDCQRIFCGEKWTPRLGNLVNAFAKTHAVLIGSYLEVAIFAKLKPDVLLVDADKKPQIVLDATRNKIGKCKICILCEYTPEVIHLSNVFKEEGYRPLLAHSDMVLSDIKAVEQLWKTANGFPVLICCDDVLHQIVIDDAEMLVHYSLPSESKTNFGYRFSTLMKNHPANSREVTNGKEASVLILVDDRNHYQLPHVMDFVLRVGGKINEKILCLSREISWRIEASKKETPICFDVLEFGECRKLRSCNRRHALISEIDSSEVFQSGHVKFQILHIHTVSHLSVHVFQYIPDSGCKTEIEDATSEISNRMREFYAIEENRKFIGAVEVNKLCAVEWEDGNQKHFQRGRIVELKKFNKFNKAVAVMVKFLDTGRLSHVSVYKLYELPEELKSYKAQALDVFLCNLLPNDFGRSWSVESVFGARSIFMKPLNGNQFWIGKIRLSLKNSLHLEPVKLCRYLENVNTHVIDHCARGKLLDQRIAVQNENHLEKLRSLCDKANMQLASYKADKSDVEIMEPQWAFLDGDLPKVQFVSAESASSLYLRPAKFGDLLAKLEEDCRKAGEEELNKSKKKWSPDVGMYCLAQHENMWNRGRIQSVEDGRVLVFFIDYGDCHYVDALVPIPDRLLTQLPAQAIECCLAGVIDGSALSEWVLDEIYSFSNDGRNILYASVLGKSEDSRMTGGWRYRVNLFNREGISLNWKLIDADLVEAEEDFQLEKHAEIVPSDAEEEADVSDDSASEGGAEAGDEKIVVDDADPSGEHNISEEIFDDENSQRMLEEFMALMFPGSVTKKEESSRELSEISNEKKTSPVASENPEIAKNNKKLKISEHCTPQLVWCQNHSVIQMKIMLNNVERYKFDCSATHFLFRCSLAGKLYVAGLRLFGAINPQLTEVCIKPFHVHVVMYKLCPLQWPRLPLDKERYWWIKIDVENYADKQTTYVEEICRKAVAEIKSGHIKRGKVDREINFVPSTDSEGGSEDDSDSGDDSSI